jgi:MinD superfamily P-loop ATPase
MQIAVLSGKGGTGKTFISVNLACVIPNSIYVDCDVEEPNGHLFFQPKNVAEQPVYVTVPQVKPEQCTLCRRCVDFCRYNALALIKDKLLVFQEICHSCGGCTLFCPTQALIEKERSIGVISRGASWAVDVRVYCYGKHPPG